MSGCSRRTFLLAVPAGIGAGALLKLLPGCGGGGSTSGSVTVSNGVATLTFAAFAELQQTGGAVVVSASGAPLAVARTGADTAIALSAVCTHAGCTVDWDSGATGLSCPCHGSTFAPDGTALSGPARSALASYPATVTATGIDVTIG